MKTLNLKEFEMAEAVEFYPDQHKLKFADYAKRQRMPDLTSDYEAIGFDTCLV